MVKQLIPLTLFLFIIACSRPSPESTGGRHLIQNKGSDSMVTVALAWAERYETVVPEVGIAVTSGGSGTGISALLNGTVDIANATRRMTPAEFDLAGQREIDPAVLVVGFDAPAFIVHENNPIQRLERAQLAEIYGEGGMIETWSQLGVEVPGCDSDEIVRVSRQNNSGTYVYLRQQLLGDGRDYKLGSRDLQGSKEVVRVVSQTPCAIGYTALAYAPPAAVKIPCLVTRAGGECVVPSIQSAVDGTYDLARPLLMYTRADAPAMVRDYLDWVLSDEGQCIVRERGYAPLKPVFCP